MAEELGATFKIVDFTVIPSAEPGREGKMDAIITYMDNAGRTRMIVIPYEELKGKSDEEKFEIIKKKVFEHEKERLTFIGKEFKI